MEYLATAKAIPDLYKEEPQEVKKLPSSKVGLSDSLKMVEEKERRDSEILSCVCDDQGSQ